MKSKVPYASIPKLWPGETIVCLGTGPSLSLSDVEACNGLVPVIAINDAYTVAPWADVLYAADEAWWKAQKGAPSFPGMKVTIEPQIQAWPGLQMLQNTGPAGIELTPTGLRSGLNSGYQAINLAVHLGAARIVLLGYDLHGGHFYAAKSNKIPSVFAGWLAKYATLVQPLRDLGIEILNCTPGSALKVFQFASLPEALSKRVA